MIPIQVGGRLTGKAGPFSLGIINIQADDEEVSDTPATNFTSVRVKRDILRRSNIGVLCTNRSDASTGKGANQAFGVDAAFSFYQNLSFGGYYARTQTPGLVGDDDSYQTKFDYGGDRYGARIDFLKVGDNFNPEVGFVRRDNFRRSFAQLRFSPRPRIVRRVRKYSYSANFEYIENGAGTLETRQQSGTVNVEFNNSDRLNLDVNRNYEFLIKPFTVGGVVIPVGGYSFADATVSYMFGSQRRVSGNVSVTRGEFYNGDITTLSVSRGRVSVTNRLSLEPSLSLSRVELPVGNFTTAVIRSRGDYGFSPRMFASGLMQYNHLGHAFSSNLRFRWEYRPGSELFVVWTDERDTWSPARGGIGLRNRAFVVKITRLLRF